MAAICNGEFLFTDFHERLVRVALYRRVKTDPGTHPASFAKSTEFISRRKAADWGEGGGVDHPPQSRAEIKERVELYLYFPSPTSWPVLSFYIRGHYIGLCI
jgi:hypothetical protein